MGGTPNVLGMVNDPEFQGYSPSDKRQALYKLTGDDSFNKLKDSETLQFVSRLSGKSSEAQQKAVGLPGVPGAPTPQPNNLATILTGPPLMGAESGLPSPAQVPENAERMQQGAAIGSIAAAPIAGGARALVPVARTLIGGAGGSALGRYGGSEIGSMFGQRDLGGQIGATVGGLAGGVLGAKGVGVPSRYGLLERLFANPEVSQATKVEVAKQALADNPGIAENPQDLISRMQKIVQPGEAPTAADLKRAGDLTQTPLDKLKILAKFGDRLAQNELNRRLKQ